MEHIETEDDARAAMRAVFGDRFQESEDGSITIYAPAGRYPPPPAHADEFWHHELERVRAEFQKAFDAYVESRLARADTMNGKGAKHAALERISEWLDELQWAGDDG